jgi:serine/threonine protein kinase
MATTRAKPTWVRDTEQLDCKQCDQPFTIVRRRHHCRSCGKLFCDLCSAHTATLPAEWGYSGPQRVCDACYASQVPKERALADAILTAQFYVRAYPSYQYDKPVPGMGRSFEKYYIIIHDTGSKAECLLVVLPTENSPWQLSSETQKSYFNNTLLALKHPNVLPVLAVDSMKEKGMIALVRSLSQKGSLRDYIYKTKPLNSHDKKYLAGTKKQVIDTKLFSKWGKQILEGMLYLHAQGLPVTFVHSGNVILQGDNCYISDVENTFLGLQTATPQPATPQLALASLLHEMGTGSPLSPSATTLSSENASSLPAAVADAIKALITAAHASPTPAFESVANLPFFSGVSNNLPKLEKKMLSFIKKFAGKTKADAEEMNKKARLLKQQSSSAGLSLSTSTPLPSAPQADKSTTTTTTTTTSTTIQPAHVPPPPKQAPAAPSGPPPPPPPPAGVPPPTAPRVSLLDSIRNPNNLKKLKKVSVDDD